MSETLNTLIEFIKNLEKLPAELYEMSYSPGSFGNWIIVIRNKGKRFRIIFDGRDGFISIEISSSRKTPDLEWTEIWRKKILDNWQNEIVNYFKRNSH